MRTLEEAKESSVPIKNLQDAQAELTLALRERDQLTLQVENLNLALKSLEDSKKPVEAEKVDTPIMFESSAKSVDPSIESSELKSESAWEIEEEGEGWGWNPEVNPEILPIVPNAEIRLQAKIDELEDHVKALEAEKSKILEDNSNISAKCGKLIKKLKEYKFQVDNLQQQIKSRKLTSDLCDLDSMFSDEMNSQISGLEKSLADAKDELKVALKEKESMMSRLDVLMAANEQHVEMKEKQDMQLEVLEIRNRDMTKQLDVLQKFLDTVTDKTDDNTAIIMLNLVRELQDKEEALDAENQELQKALIDQRTNRLALEAKLAKVSEDADQCAENVKVKDELENMKVSMNEKNEQLQKDLEKVKEEYNALRKQYEQSLMDANDQVQVMRQNSDLLKEEVEKRKEDFEAELENQRKEAEDSISRIREQLQQVLAEKEEMSQILNQRIQEVGDLQKESEHCAESLQGEADLQLIIQKCHQEANTKELEIENMKQLLLQKEEEIVQKREEMVQKEEEVVQKQEKMVQKQEEIDRLVTALDEKIQKEAELMQNVQSLEADLRQFVARVQSNENNLQLMQNRIYQVEYELDETTKMLMEKNELIQELRDKLQGSKQEVEMARLEVRQLVSKLEVSDQELERISDFDNNKTESYNILNLEFESKKQELLERESIVDDLQKKIVENQLIVEHLQRLVLEKDVMIAEGRNRIIKDEEEHRQAIMEKEATIVERETSIVEKQATIVEKEATIAEKEATIAEKEATIVEKEAKIVENEAMIVEKAAIIEDIQKRITENEDLHHQKIIQKDEELDQKIVEKERELRQMIFEKEEELRQKITEKEEEHRQKIFEKEEELRLKFSERPEKSRKDSENLRKTGDDVPIFRMGDQDEIDQLRIQLNQKQLQIEHLESSLSVNTYTQIIQELQDTVNQLYNEKAHFEKTLASFSQNMKDQVSEKEAVIKSLRQELDGKEGTQVSPRMGRRKRSLDEEENQRLRDALRAWEQEVQDLRQILAEKDAQLMEDSSGVDKMMIERLMSEKEQMRLESQETLERMLAEKETQIEEVRSRLEAENESLLNDLKLREREIENLRVQIEEMNSAHDEELQRKMAEVAFVGSDLAERDRRLYDVSATKDAEIQNLKLQIHDRELRIEELQALSDEEERQISDLKMILETRDHEVGELKQQIEEKIKELELIQHALRRHVTKFEDQEGTSLNQGDGLNSSANELDLALYMLHQRDVRCEELTLELMQLLEERDTLQLRLSNAIRINEEMRRSGSPSKSLSMSSGSLPLVEDPSPSRAEGPVEIAKDALDSSIGEDKQALAQKYVMICNFYAC